jgi:hypothetical protein
LGQRETREESSFASEFQQKMEHKESETSDNPEHSHLPRSFCWAFPEMRVDMIPIPDFTVKFSTEAGDRLIDSQF